MGATLLTLATVGLIMPTLYYYVFAASTPLQPAQVAYRRIPQRGDRGHPGLRVRAEPGVLVCHASQDFRAQRTVACARRSAAGGSQHEHVPAWGRGKSLVVLILATVGVAVMSELLVDSAEQAAHALGMSSVFVGVIVVAIVGNAAEHSTAVLVAMKNKMDLAVNIAVGSGIQIALFVAPVLVFASMAMGHEHPLDLHFTLMEIVAVTISIVGLGAGGPGRRDRTGWRG